MLAVIQTGGKQFLVGVGEKVKVPKMANAAGDKVKFDVLFVADEEEKVLFGDDEIAKATVEATVLSQEAGPKVKGIKHKPKKRYLVRYGQRQPYTHVEITSIKAK